MKKVNETIWVLRNPQGEFFCGYGNFTPNFIEALFYADPDGAERDRDSYEYEDCTVQAVCCTNSDMAPMEGTIWQEACRLACQDCPVKCPDLPEYYNLQNEYGSDEPYWVKEGGCEFECEAQCLECTVKHYYRQAKNKIINHEVNK